MAACSELELEGKSTQEKRLLCSKSFDSTTNKDDAFNTQKACNSEMPKTTITIEQEGKNTVDIGSLTEEQLQSLLEEATTFNRPKDEASSILRALRKQIKDSDDVKEAAAATGNSVAGSGPPIGVASSVASHNSSNSKRKNRNSGNAPCHRGRLLLANDDTLMVDYSSNRIQLTRNSDIGSGATGGSSGHHWLVKTGRDYSSELQSQSLQDLATGARFADTHDSMRAAGIGRGNRRFQKAGRANSFTENSSEWTGLGAQMSTLDRTQGRVVKANKPRISASNRTSWTGQMVVNSSDAENNNAVGISSNIAKPSNDPCTLFTDCEYEVGSGDGSGGKVWSAGSSDSSSPDKEDSQMDTIPVSSCDTNDSGVSLLSCRPLSDNEFCPLVTQSDYGSLEVVRRRVGSPPLEIEMIDMAKAATFGEVGECGSTFVCNRIQDGFADVDAPVLFPLKAGSSGHNNMNCSARPGPVNGIYQLQDRYRSLISSNDGKDEIKFYQTVDFSSSNNPLMRTMRIPDGTILTNFSTAGGNYSFEGAPSRNELSVAGSHGRKMKRTKSNAETGVKRAEDCDGYRGKDDVDSLVEYINSTDKNKANHSHGTTTAVNTATIINTSTISGSNSSNNNTKFKGNGTATVVVSVCAKIGGSVSDSDRKKVSVSKEKYCKGLKKKPNSSESADEDEAGEEAAQPIGNDCMEPDWDVGVADASTAPDEINTISVKVDAEKCIAVKSLGSQRLKEHAESICMEVVKVSPLSSPPSSSSGSVITQSDEVFSSFVKDFYAVTDLSPQLMEESEFRVVVNKQRKRKQVKKPDGFRRYGNTCSNVPAGVGSGGSSERDYYLQESPCHHSMLLSGMPLSHRTQRGQSEFARRKSTSSMPPSEPSSADNSDLDSVHSLPVSGTAPPLTGPHPHTTPSSMSSTPQASYADIARMSTQMTLGKGKCEMLQPTNPGPGSFSCPAVPTSVSPNPPPTVSAAVQTSASDIETSESEPTSIETDVPIAAEQLEMDPVAESRSRQLSDKTFPECSSIASSSQQTSVTTKSGAHLVNTNDFSLGNPNVPHTKSSSAVTTTEVSQHVDLPVPRSVTPTVLSDPTPAAKKSNLVSSAKSGNPSDIVLPKPSNSPATGLQKQACAPSTSGVVKGPTAAVTVKHTGPPPSVKNSAHTPAVSSLNNPAIINVSPSITTTSNPYPPSNPVAHMSTVPGPHFLQESTIVCQRLNQTAKPSPGRYEPNLNYKTDEPSYSRARPSTARSEGAVRKPAPPVITLDKGSPLAATFSLPQATPPSCLCDISFGVDMREILQLGVQGGQHNPTFEFEQCSHHAPETESIMKTGHSQVVPGGGSRHGCTASSLASTVAAASSSAKESSPEEGSNIVVVSGKRLQWKENEAETRNFNHSQVVNFFGTAWDSVLHDYKKDTTREGKKSGKVCYYSSYC